VPPAQMLQLGRESMLDASAMPTDGRQRRYSDLGHLLPISGNSRNVQVSCRSTLHLYSFSCYQSLGVCIRHVQL